MSLTPQVLRELRDAIADISDEWITVEEWCRRTGDSLEAVYSRRSKGLWQDGVHANKPVGGGVWVNATAARRWRDQRGTRNDGPTELYRHYAADGVLLYVGISKCEAARRSAHKHSSAWFAQVASTLVTAFPSRREALRAELVAIRDEHPLHNIRGRR